MNPLLAPFAAIYGWGGEARSAAYRRGWLKRRRLSHPVISVGNLTMGGTGKTPLVVTLAKLLSARGAAPAILTRGYGRKAGAPLLVLDPSPSRSTDPRETGDEPALLARTLPGVPIAICADRHRGGRAIEERFQVDAFLLDDGFQHLRLARDADIVTLDATRPISDEAVLPAGRQRERCSALRRAQIAVITRAGQADSSALEERLFWMNPRLPVFHARTKLRGWIEAASGRRLPPDFLVGRRVCAFCAIGNSKAFFHDLARWGCDLAGAHAFRDHHHYTNSDVAHLVLSARNAGNTTLVTTEKDLMNLPADWKPDLNAFACVIESEILEAEEFEQTLLRLISFPVD